MLVCMISLQIFFLERQKSPIEYTVSHLLDQIDDKIKVVLTN